MRITRQFTAGFESVIAQVPKGRLNPFMSYVSSYSHCVFSTKDRRPCLTAQLRDRLWPFLGGIAREHQMKALSIGGVEDHVHLLHRRMSFQEEFIALLKRHKIEYDERYLWE